jgi:hypothetical protein
MIFFKYIKIFIFTFLFLCILSTVSYSMEIITRDELNMDENLSEQIEIYSAPKKIYVSQLDGFNTILSDNPKEWIKLLYYYSVTKLSLSDIPYNFLIDSSGNIYEGAKGGIGINVGIENGENVILIGIMDNSSTLSPRAAGSLKEFVEDLSYKYGIKKDSWDFVDMKIKTSGDCPSSFTFVKSSRSLLNPVKEVFSEVNWSKKQAIKYKGSITSVEYEKDVVIGDKLDVIVKIKNENDFAWFGDLEYIYVSTKDSVESNHSINGVWESFSKPTYIKDTYIKPSENAEVNFQLETKSKPGKYEEDFYFMLSPELEVEDSSFKVEFNIVKGDNKIIEIVSPEYGYVNIRECKGASCKKVEVANEGDVYITTSKVDGWYEIIYGDDKKGWIVQRFAKEI